MAVVKPLRISVEIDAETLTRTGADPRDAKLAARVVKAANELQEAMDSASRAGLILEPDFKRFASKDADYGVSSESFLCTVEVYRKLI